MVRVSRSIKDMAYHAMKAKEFLQAEKMAEPTVSEIAEYLKADRIDVVIALESITAPMSLYEPVLSYNGDSLYVLDQIGDRNEEGNWLDEISLKEILKSLNEREKTIVQLRFYEGKTQMEVSKIIGISQAQVSRLEKGVIDKIKS